MEGTAPAFIAFTAAILVGFTSHFVAEDYRRFRDGQAVAAALAGELRSIISVLPDLFNSLIAIKNITESQQGFFLPEFPAPTSPMFEANASKIGLLGPELAGDVAFIYDQIRAFKTSFHLLSKHHDEMPLPSISALVGRCIRLIETNEVGAGALIENLKASSDSGYLMSRPIWTAFFVGITVISLSSLFGAAYRVLLVS